MKVSGVKRLHGKTVVDLRKDLKEAREELRNLRFDLAAGKVKNISRVHEAKKKIARLLTLIKQKENETSN